MYLNVSVSFDIETTSFNDDVPEEYTDHDVYEYLKGQKIRINQQVFSDIPDLPLIRRSLFGQLYLSKTEGVAVDILYPSCSAKPKIDVPSFSRISKDTESIP